MSNRICKFGIVAMMLVLILSFCCTAMAEDGVYHRYNTKSYIDTDMYFYCDHGIKSKYPLTESNSTRAKMVTCDAPGMARMDKCADCMVNGANDRVQVEVPAMGHCWTNGACDHGCDTVHPCTTYTNGVCDVCGASCTHEDWGDDGICDECGVSCVHDWSNEDGLCPDCGFECEHEEWDHNGRYTAPTCTKNGYDSGEYKCALCGVEESRGAETLYATDHDLEYTYVENREPTCTTRGIAKVTCNNGCGMTAYYTTVPAQHGLSGSHYDRTEMQFACYQDGLEIWICDAEDCGEEFEVWYHADGEHVWEETPALYGGDNCEEDSVVGYKCIRGWGAVREMYPEMNRETFAGNAACDEIDVIYVVEGSAKNHVQGERVKKGEWAKLGNDEADRVYNEKNCEQPTWELYWCKDCSIAFPVVTDKYGVADKEGHGDLVSYTIPATCTENEQTGYECEDCGQTVYTEEAENAAPATGHYYELNTAHEDYVEATCQEDGVNVKTCALCGDTFTEEIGRDWENHEWKIVSDPTSEQTCRTLYKYECEFCEGVWKYDYEVKHIGVMVEVEDESEDATCVAEGVLVEQCSECGEKVYTTLAPLGGDNHEYMEQVVPATCTENTKWGKICTKCGMEFSDVVEFEDTALGHNFIEDDIYIAVDEDGELMMEPADCLNNGYVVYFCAGHIVDGVHYECSDEEAATQEFVIPATGEHEWKTEELAADCLNNQRVVKYCVKCDFVESSSDVVGGAQAHGQHDYKVDEEESQVANCQEGGYNVYVCSKCGDSYEADYTPVDPSNHSDEEMTDEIREGSCTTSGIGKFKCNDCGKVYYKVTPAEHEYAMFNDEVAIYSAADESKLVESIDKIAVDCLTEGVYFNYCTKCNTFFKQTIPTTGEHKWVDVEVSADCLNDYKAGRICTVCKTLDDNFTTVPGTALNHAKSAILLPEMVDEDVFKAAMAEYGLTKDELTAALLMGESTCTKNAYVAYQCERVDANDIKDFEGNVVYNGEDETCLYQWIEKLELAEHQEDEGAPVDANCLFDEHIVFTCTECGEVLRRVGVDGGDVTLGTGAHEYEIDEEQSKVATCQEGGYNVYVCSKCGDSYKADYTGIDSENHAWTSEKIVKAATNCVEGGIMAYECEKCETGVIYKAYYAEHDFPEHDEDEWFDIVDADCINDGSYTVKCTKCEETKTYTLYAVGEHMWGHDDWDEGMVFHVCVVCGEREDIFYEWCDHSDYTVEYDGNGNCEEVGNAHFWCNNELCRHEWDEEYGNWGHNIITDKAVAATCTTTGLTAGEHCEFCDEKTVAQEVVGMIDHLPVDGEAKEATCTETGLTAGKVCGVCGEPLEDQVVTPALNHPLTDKVAGKAATCTEAGLTDGTICLLCDAMVDEQEVIEALGHTEEVIPGVAATCTDAGLTEGKICSVCETITVEQEIVEALGHTAEVIPAVAATCTKTGLTAGEKCSVCGVVTVAQTEVAKVAHTAEVIPAVAATCTKTGLTAGEKCSVCGEITVAQTEVAKVAHTYTVAWDFNADFTAKVKIETCTKCGEVVKTEVAF